MYEYVVCSVFEIGTTFEHVFMSICWSPVELLKHIQLIFESEKLREQDAAICTRVSLRQCFNISEILVLVF